MEENVALQLTALNQNYKETNQIYHHYAKNVGISDTTFWLLYGLWERGEAYPQRELCEDWSYTPQTVNSAIKALEQQGIIELVFAQGSRKSKEISFTEAGRALAEKVIAPLMQAERAALSGLGASKREQMLSGLRSYSTLLEKEIGTITGGTE